MPVAREGSQDVDATLPAVRCSDYGSQAIYRNLAIPLCAVNVGSWIPAVAAWIAFGFPCSSASAQNAAPGKANLIKYGTTHHEFADVDAAWLSGWLRRVGVELPPDLQGKVSADIDISWPFGALADPKQYRIDALVVSDQMQVGPLVIGDVKANIDYRDGVATLDKITFDLLDDTTLSNDQKRGRVEGKAATQLLPLDRIVVDVRAEDVSAEYLASQFNAAVESPTGSFSGNLTATSDFASFRTIDGWAARGTLSGKQLSIQGRPKTDVRDAKFKLEEGKLRVERLLAETDGGQAIADGEIELDADLPWTLNARLARMELTEATRWLDAEVIEASGTATGSVTINGTFAPFQWQANGTLESDSALVEQISATDSKITFDARGGTEANSLRANGKLQAAMLDGKGLGQGKIESINLNYQLTDDIAELTEITGRVGDGSFRATAKWPFGGDENVTANGNWSELDLGPFFMSRSRQRITLNAESNGEFQWSVPANSITDLDQHNLTARAEIPNVVVNGRSSGRVNIDITQPNGEIRYAVDGELFDGRIEGSGQLKSTPLVAGVADTDATPEGRFKLTDVDLGEFARAVFRDPGREWRGRLNLSAQTSIVDGTAKGNIEVSGLRYQDELITDALKGNFNANAGRISLERVSGRFLDGRLTADGRIDYSGRGQLNLQMNRIASDKAARVFAPVFEDYVSGPLSVRLRATGNKSWRATGTVAGNHVRFGPFNIKRLRAPVAGSLSPTGGVSIESRDVRAYLPKGLIVGKAKSEQRQSGLELASQWKFNRVGIQELEDALGGSGAIGSGDMSGTLSLHGKRIRGFRDLNGALRIDINDAGARSLPLVPQLQRFALGVDLSGTTFRDGTLKARLARGRVKVEELRFAGPSFSVFAEGDYAPLTERIDLEVTASTIEGTARNATRRIIVGSLSSATPTTAAFVSATEFVSDRVIQFHVGGTIRTPNFSLRPCPTLRQEVVRYFLRQLTAEAIDVQF